MKPRGRLSLKARALQWLAQREHSRLELRRKLLPLAALEAAVQVSQAECGDAAAADAVDADGPAADEPAAAMFHGRTSERQAAVTPEVERSVDELLDWLEARAYLSDERFVDSRVRAREARLGMQRIRQELARHGAELSAEAAEALKASEATRAAAVWQRKFGEPAADAAGRARQMRFLAARGFDPDVIRRVVPATRRVVEAGPDQDEE